jgi:hypothetical protein
MRTILSKKIQHGAIVHRLILFIVVCSIVRVSAQDQYYDYVQEILEEDQQHYNDYYEDPYSHQDNIHQQQQQQPQQQQQREDAELMRKAEEERVAQEKTDRIAMEREKVFQAELDKMNEDQKKAALRQKRKDAKIVRSILKAARNNKYYAVLGIRNWQLRIPPRDIKLGKYQVTIPGITLKHTSTKDIRKAFRNRALSAHPDKNRDGKAQEAFIAVEAAASVLSDERLRAEYDEEVKLVTAKRRHESKRIVVGVIDTVRGFVGKIIFVFRSVLGPFATPVIIIGALLI